MTMRAILLAVLTLALAGCGFHLRGAEAVHLPFQTLYVEGDAQSGFVKELKQEIAASGSTRLVGSPAQAQAVLKVLGESRNKTILSLSGSGRVAQYNLIYRVSFQLQDAKGKLLILPSDITLQQWISYSDTEVLAKESEEAQLYRDMQSEAARQVLRRLRLAKLRPAAP